MKDEIIKIEELGKRQTYDFQVAGTNSFVANKIVVHNSGVLEENPDVVLICHCRYKYTALPEDYNTLEISVAKKRGGRTGSAFATLTPEFYRIK
jgi:hypothetical protein